MVNKNISVSKYTYEIKVTPFYGIYIYIHLNHTLLYIRYWKYNISTYHYLDQIYYSTLQT